jgi:hypothetical protein
MNTKTVGDFRVRCAVVQERGAGYNVQVWTRRMGANAPEKAWPVPMLKPFDSEDAALLGSQALINDINGVRFNGEPEYAHASA